MFNPKVSRILKAARVLPVLFWCFLANHFSGRKVTGEGECVVSLTSYSTRVRYVYLAIESIARGEVRPGRLILWIDDPRIIAALPRTLQRLQRRGLEIKPTPNFGPHKKYYSYLESDDSGGMTHPLVTSDDDIIYPSYWLAGLLASYRAFPDSISCYRAHRLVVGDGTIAPYQSWEPCTNNSPSFTTFSTGASGALYPPELLLVLKERGRVFLEVAPKADDVWLHSTAVKNRFKTRQVEAVPIEFPVIPGTQKTALSRENVSLDGNDVQIRVAYDDVDVEVLASAGAQS